MIGGLLLTMFGVVWHGGERGVFKQKKDIYGEREFVTESEYAQNGKVDRIALPTAQYSAEEPARERIANFKLPSWGNTAIQLGFSFLVAMVVGALLRAFIRTMLAILLVVGAFMFFFESRGIIEPFWGHGHNVVNGTKDWVGGQTSSAKSLLQVSLPSSIAATIGFFFGLRK